MTPMTMMADVEASVADKSTSAVSSITAEAAITAVAVISDITPVTKANDRKCEEGASQGSSQGPQENLNTKYFLAVHKQFSKRKGAVGVCSQRN